MVSLLVSTMRVPPLLRVSMACVLVDKLSTASCSATGSMTEDVTQLLIRSRKGETVASQALETNVYEELRHVARIHMAKERPGHTLAATALVHEAYIRLIRTDEVAWNDRQHFLAVASRAMRHILVDYTRRRNRKKRKGNAVHLSLDRVEVQAPMTSDDILALDDALTALERYEPRLARLVELRFFGGMTLEEAAREMAFSSRSATRAWVRARAFLLAYLADEVG